MPEPTALAKIYPAGIVYKARVALKNPIMGSIVLTASSDILKPSGGGYLRKAQFTMDMMITLKMIPNAVEREAETTSFSSLEYLTVIQRATYIPSSIPNIATRLQMGPMGRAPGNKTSKVTVFTTVIATPIVGPKSRNAVTMGISHI